jgi:carbamoyltransferase
MRVLGISAYYHDSAAALVEDGEILAAAQEERFTRKRHDPSFPKLAVNYVLKAGGIDLKDLDAIAFYEKPFLKFERLLETYHGFAPKGGRSFTAAMPIWIKEKLHMRKLIRKQLTGASAAQLLFPEHHLSHAASAYYPSPFEEAAILTVDGVGEWATTTIGVGEGASIQVLRELRFPHSLGLLYSAFTQYLGFKVNSGEYKVMGLAPYGDAYDPQTTAFRDRILDQLIDLRPDGSYLLNMDYFDYATGLSMIRPGRWKALFGMDPRKPESVLTLGHQNLALALQQVTNEAVLGLARAAADLSGKKSLVIAGGVALNCVSNAAILRSGLFDQVWVQPAAGDAGGALGAALAGYHIGLHRTRPAAPSPASAPARSSAPSPASFAAAAPPRDKMKAAALGPSFTDEEIRTALDAYEAVYEHVSDTKDLTAGVARLLADGKVVGWFQGRMEFGPRALGQRSILADPRLADMKARVNEKIKARETFRPFAPSVLAEAVDQYFEAPAQPAFVATASAQPAPEAPAQPASVATMPVGAPECAYMQFTLQHKKEGVALPAVIHVDGSARVQTVNKVDHPLFWQLISDFNALTGCPVLLNTSFNQRGEPMVCSPEDAYEGLLHMEIDYVVIGPYVLERNMQDLTRVNALRAYDPD